MEVSSKLSKDEYQVIVIHMHNKLFLTSEGIQPNLKKEFLSLLIKTPEKNKVLFITTAAYGENNDVGWLENHRKMLRDCKIKQITDLDLRNTNRKELKTVLEHYDIVFVAGGNTYFLLKYVKKSGFDKLIKEFINNGGIYVGNSAGSYIACPTIEQSAWKQRFIDKNTYDLTDLSSLDLMPFWIVAHFAEKWRKDIEMSAAKTKYPVIALNDKQAVLVEGNQWKIVGEGEKLTFNL